MAGFLSQIADYVITQSWQIALLVLIVAAITFALKNRSAHVRYLLWLLVLAKCLIPPMFSVPLAVLPKDRPVILETALPLERGIARQIEPSIQIEPTFVQQDAAIPEKSFHFTKLQILVFVWLTGVIIFLFIAILKAIKTNLWLKGSRRVLPAKLQKEIEESFTEIKLKDLPRLWLVDDIGQPFVWGFLRGDIYLPTDFIRLKDSNHRKDILGHEISHVLRFDASINLLQVIAQAIFWFHPFVWWTNKKIRTEREKCCDETAIARFGATPKDYSAAIVNALITEHKATRPLPSLAVAGPVKNIEERIKTMLRPGKKFYKRPTLSVAIVAIVIALLIVPTTLVLTARAQTKPTAERERDPVRSLLRAAADGNIEEVKSLISKGADINERGAWGNTALHYACMKGHADVARLLISEGAYVNAVSGSYPGQPRLNEMTPLHCAAASGDRQTIQLLLSKGANLEAKSRYGLTPLLVAMRSAAPGRKEVVELLLARGAKVPALHLAAYIGDMDKVKECLQKGADVNSQADDGGTALHAAACSGKKDIVELLISKGANVDPKDASGLTPLYYAATHNAEQIVDLLVAKGADVNTTNETEDGYGRALLHYAIAHDDSKDAVKLLISKGANVNVVDWDGFTPLMWATWEVDKDIVELLISKGADVNQEDNYGCSVLTYVASSKDLVELLIAKGAAPISAIHLAASAGDLDEVKRLVEEGVDANTRAKGSGGWTPLFAAVFGDHIDVARFLITKGADVNAKDMAGLTPLHNSCEQGKRNMAELLIAEGADVNARDLAGRTPLHRMFIIGRDHMDVAELLIAEGANVNAKVTGTRWTPLHYAVESGDARIVRLLSDNDADINAPTTDGQTPLHIACECGHKDVVEMLVAKGADINAKDDKGQTALSLAKAQEHDKIAELLRKHGAND
jgi:ankyrin repeat protein/beta-lactamase regulating signal transducer with metallopeptidase domain